MPISIKRGWQVQTAFLGEAFPCRCLAMRFSCCWSADNLSQMGVGLWLYQVHVTWHGVYFSSGMVKWEHAAAAAAVVSIRSLLVVLNEGSDLKPMLQHPLSSWTQGGLPSAQTQKHISPHTATVKLNTGWTASTNTHTHKFHFTHQLSSWTQGGLPSVQTQREVHFT